ncbi:LPS biosynthesis-modulating metalloenzyme YejM [Erwinia tracheiphila]|uniref:Inner membrane protein YejM n=1 Tax=Erwinia tracheiphila TaxID=65700 RepID=A0A0M2KAI0_9GAMM|nr:LPS biosynthesis-modulating metalloenzyme YejM [Erwinia tracheiphila]EOS92834.1 sulfatase [Erwinia tracheiphila PSU-1]KKF34277.1 membrane protein [Erwinia tracheiphila]UIA89309.1 LPS biosynthesis-modulating metalloenzyme YejM [Erwinia tracheiphila]UIA97692.1 LPS biosynthesis-modulating metalloenzyme YejM [Erwinia tracheiphila]
MVTSQQRYREKVSQMIGWGHWFALFNILFAFILGSRYLFVSDWPASLVGRIYAFTSWIGHFSFIVFATYLLIIFPLTFVVMSQRLLRFLSAIVATAGLTLILVDSAVFNRFHLHLNPVVWELVINPDQSELTRDWQLMFISVPAIFLVEMLFATWSWQKLRSLNRRNFGKPLAVLFISAFCSSHIMYIWADANFYRPITMQRANLPLSYPMTARRFLEKHGLLNAQEYQRRLVEQGAPGAVSVAYPLNNILFRDGGTHNNLLMITVDGLNAATLQQSLPHLAQFASQNLNFTQHFSSGSAPDSGLFGLFYGISPSYMDGVLSARMPSALIDALSKQGYQFGLFASDGFASPLYRQALLADYSLPPSNIQHDGQTVVQWQTWFEEQNSTNAPWFSYLSFSGRGLADSNQDKFLHHYERNASDVDNQIQHVLSVLRTKGVLDNTVVVITAQHGVALDGDISMGNRANLRVPLIVHWPNTPAQQINKLTDHADIMTTLMQRLLHVSTAPSDYSQGEDLFAARRRNDWVASNSNHKLVVTTSQITLLLDNNGSYTAWDNAGNQLKDHKPQLALLLQVLTEEKRFIAN